MRLHQRTRSLASGHVYSVGLMAYPAKCRNISCNDTHAGVYRQLLAFMYLSVQSTARTTNGGPERPRVRSRQRMKALPHPLQLRNDLSYIKTNEKALLLSLQHEQHGQTKYGKPSQRTDHQRPSRHRGI